MNKKRKNFLYAGGGIAGLVMVIFLLLIITNNKSGNKIPQIPDSSALPLAVNEQISDAFKIAHRNPLAINLGKLGMVYHSNANYKEATQCYKLAIKKSKSDWKWYYYLGYINIELGESDKVVENFSKVIEIHPDIDLARYYIGEAYINLKKNELAEKAFSKIINNKNIPAEMENIRNDYFPLSIYAMYQLSKIYFETGRMELAEKTLIKLLRQNDVFGPAFRLLGNIYKTKGDIAQGEEYITRANDLFLFSPPVDSLVDKLALMSRSELYLMKKIDESAFNGYSEWALALVEQGLKYIPDNKTMLSKAIKVYMVKNMKQKAAGLINQHINAFIDDYAELVSAGKLFFQNGMYKEAEEYWINALKIKSEDVAIYKNLAMCFWKTGENQKAQEILTEAAEKYQDNPDNLAEIILVFIQFKNVEKANQYLKKLKQPTSKNPKIQKLYGKIEENNGNLKAAISMYESSFKGNPKDDETIHFFGDFLFYKEMWNKYIEFYKEVLKYNPNIPEFLEKLSTILINCPDKSLRNLDEGIKYSIRAFSNKDSSLHILLSSGKNLAVALASKGDKQNALKTIEKTIKISQIKNASENEKQELQQLYQVIQKL